MAMSVVLERPPVDPSGRIGVLSNQLKRQRVYIFPTLQGWLYAVMLVVMLLGAINYNNSMAFMLCFLLASLGLVCMINTYRNLAGLILTSTTPKPVFAEQQALFPIQLDNRLGLARYSIQIESYETIKILFRKRKQRHIVSVSVKAGKPSTSYYPVKTTKRGILKLERLKLSTNFPLGLFSAWAYFEPEFYCLIYPTPKGNKQLPQNVLQKENVDYGMRSGTDDFSGFRKYRPGDPVNSIAWKAFAREQGLLVKQFSGKGSQTLILSWDAVSYINDVESRLSQLCYWVLLAEKSSIQYGLEIPDKKIDPGLGTHHKEHCLEALARYGKQ
jgi:uncharacterized protein (DUF58 family)